MQDCRLGFRSAHDTSPLEVDEILVLESADTTTVGDWYALGQQTSDVALASLHNPKISIVQPWSMHYDVRANLAVNSTDKPGDRVNLGAAADDGFNREQCIYVNPEDPSDSDPTSIGTRRSKP